jgi:ABC-type transport system involved in cytochrome c biogenesis permease subunit
MIFLKNQQRKSSVQIKSEHNERCAKLFASLAFFLLILLSVMLYLAISSQYSEQKTTYYVVFACSALGFLTLSSLSVYQFLVVKKEPPPDMHRLSFIHLAPQLNQNQQQIDDQYFRNQIRFQA